MRGRLAYRLSVRSLPLDEAFSIALREDFRVTKAYTKPSVVTFVRPSGPEPMEIDVWPPTRVTPAPGVRWFAFVVESQGIARLSAARQRRYRRMRWTPIMRALPRLHVQKTAGTSRCRAPYWLERRSGSPGGSPTFQPSCAACTFKCHHYEW